MRIVTVHIRRYLWKVEDTFPQKYKILMDTFLQPKYIGQKIITTLKYGEIMLLFKKYVYSNNYLLSY